jgi:uncharacterized protein DUF4190
MTNSRYQPDTAAVPARALSLLAVAAMVVSWTAVPFTVLVLWIYLFTWAVMPALVLSIIGLNLGTVALKQLRSNSQSGRGMALTGTVVASLCLVFCLIRVITAFNDLVVPLLGLS